MKPKWLLFGCLGLVALCGFGTWSCIGEYVWREIPDGAPPLATTPVTGPAAGEILIDSNGCLSWKIDGHVVVDKKKDCLPLTHPKPHQRIFGSGWQLTDAGLPSPDGKYLARDTPTFFPAGSMNYTCVDAKESGVTVYMRHAAIRMMAGAWDGDRLVLGGIGGYLGVFDVKTGRRQWRLIGHGKAEIIAAAVRHGKIYSLDDTGQVRTVTLP